MSLFKDQTTPLLPFAFPQKEGYSYEFNAALNVFQLKIPDGELIYAEHFFDKKISQRSMEYFLENEDGLDEKTDWRMFEKGRLSAVRFTNIDWQHDQIKMFGKKTYVPRFSAWYGDEGKAYTYSGITFQPKTWNKGLLYLKAQVDKIAGVNFNSVLMNWYRDGEDYMGWHTDAEKELGVNPVIGSVNFGSTRRFLLRRIDNKQEKVEIPLKQGTLLIMQGALQHYWQHTVPKQLRAKGHRFNLTFRVIK